MAGTLTVTVEADMLACIWYAVKYIRDADTYINVRKYRNHHAIFIRVSFSNNTEIAQIINKFKQQMLYTNHFKATNLFRIPI